MAAESPWSNGLAECHNAVFGLTVSKTTEETVTWMWLLLVLGAPKPLLKMLMVSHPTNLCLQKNTNFPNVSGNLLAVLESQTISQTVAENLNALHSARNIFIKNETPSKTKLALKHQTHTSGDYIYKTGNVVFNMKKDIPTWKGPSTMTGQDEQQILIKHGSTYVRVHP